MNSKVVVSAFDGVAIGRKSLNNAGIPIRRYLSSEIDHFAEDVVRFHHPDTKFIGDIRDVDMKSIDYDVDLLIGGSPCTDFSVAGRKRGMSTDKELITSLGQYLKLKADPNTKFHGQSYLLWEFARLYKELNPEYFLLENVELKGKNAPFIDIISDFLGCKPILVNSAEYSPQNRPRLYWTNIPIKDRFNDPHPLFSNMSIDYILDEIPVERIEKYEVEHLNREHNGSWCHQVAVAKNIKGIDSIKRVYSVKHKCPTLTTMKGGHREPKILLEGENHFRKLTPRECERVQMMDDDFTKIGMKKSGVTYELSKSRRYQLIGNSWTETVINIFANALLDAWS